LESSPYVKLRKVKEVIFMMLADVNWIAVIASAVAAMVVGFVWYSKSVLGKSWMKETGVTDSQMKETNKNMMGMYLPMFVGALVEAFILSMILTVTGSSDYAMAAQAAFLVWVGFIATTLLGAVLFERRSWTYYGINAGYQLVALIVMSVVLIAL
jgi:polyferredoxin